MEEKPREGVKMLKGLAAVVVGYVTMPFLVTRDILESLKYQNSPEMALYNPSKPTPNTVDFPDGTSRKAPVFARRLYHWANR